MRVCKNVAFDICYWIENLAKTWLISVVVYVRTFYHIFRPFEKIPVSQRVTGVEAVQILTIVPDFDTFKNFR